MTSFGRILALAIISGLFAIPAGVAATKPPVPAVPAVPAMEDQPHMQQALEALRQARRHLEEAIPDKGGHRTAAIRACDQAIRQTELGVKFGEHQDHDHDHDHN